MSTAAFDDVVPFERSREDQGWARWLARGVDSILILPIVFIIIIGLSIAVELQRLPIEFITWTQDPVLATVGEVVLTFVLFLLWEPLFLSNMGTTPGKWVMGVGVRREDGKRIGFFTGIVRYLWVWAVGLGLFIPLVALICMLISRSKLIADGATVWDEGLKLQVTHKKRHPIVWVLVIVVVMTINVGFAILSRMPA